MGCVDAGLDQAALDVGVCAAGHADVELAQHTRDCRGLPGRLGEHFDGVFHARRIERGYDKNAG